MTCHESIEWGIGPVFGIALGALLAVLMVYNLASGVEHSIKQFLI
jgi:hypothetical protein